MGNPYFKFKQFTVYQDKCAMKVSTDACIFGASIPSRNYKNILDIGTGTGLLALMLAQKNGGNLVAVEVDKNAFEQAKYNFDLSQWNKRINTIHMDINEYSKICEDKFDLIISNPPFFENHLKSSISSKNIAKHTDLLTFDALACCVDKLLAENGECYFLYPEKESLLFEKAISKLHFFKTSTLKVYQKKGSNIFRVINGYKRTKQISINEGQLIIHNNNSDYSTEFKSLLSEYYLNL